MNQLIGYLSEGEQLKGSLTIPKQIGGGGSVNLQEKSVSYTPTETAQSETVTASPGYDGLSSVEVSVEAISGSYVGSQVPRKSSSDLTASGATVTAPAGYYESAASKAIPTAGCNVGASVQKNTQTHVATISPYAEIDPAGFLEADIYDGNPVTVSASELVSGTKSITANGSGIDVTNYEDVDVNVPNSYSAGDEGKVVSNGALVSQTAHADVTPTASDQTIDTTTNNSIKVKGDADLVAGNIKKDVEIFGVTGSYEGGGGGITFAPLDYPVVLNNHRSSNTVCRRIIYNSTTIIYATNSNITANGSLTINNMATDGTHIWFSAVGMGRVAYNGSDATYVKSGDNYMLTIPAGFDGTIPFDLYTS